MNDDFEYHITFPTTVSTFSSEKEPVIVLFGWAGCTDRHLAKYSKIYEKLGCITMRFVTSPSIMSPKSINQKKIYEMAEKVVGLMIDMTFSEHPIYFHSFSNGGSVVYRHVTDVLQRKYTNQFQVKGCIFDSAPAKLGIVNFIKAAVAVTQGSMVWKYIVAIYVLLQTLLLKAFSRIGKLFVQDVLYKPMWDALIEEPNICPQLFIFSKNDMICNWETIQEFADKRKENGVKVSIILWDDSPHVQHMIYHEEAYCAAVCTFVLENIVEDKFNLDR